MDKLKDAKQRQSVTNSPNQTGVGQRVVNATRFGQPSQRAQDAAAQRSTETKWSWYLREVVQRAR